MVIWSNTELLVYSLVLAMILFKFWTVWHVSKQAQAIAEGRMIFLWGIIGMSTFVLLAKTFITYQMSTV